MLHPRYGPGYLHCSSNMAGLNLQGGSEEEGDSHAGRKARLQVLLEVLEHNGHSIRGKLLLGSSCKEVVQLMADCGTDRANELYSLGSVYIGETIKVCVDCRTATILEGSLVSPPTLGAPPCVQGQDTIKWRRANQVLQQGLETCLDAGRLIRVHPTPKRFPACQQHDW